MLFFALAIFCNYGVAELRAKVVEKSEKLGLILAFAVASLFTGFLLNQFGNWYLSPAHLHLMQKVEQFEKWPSTTDQKDANGLTTLDPDWGFWVKPIPFFRNPTPLEIDAYRAEEARQFVWMVCDPETVDSEIPGSAGRKAMRVVRGAIGGTVILFFTILLVPPRRAIKYLWEQIRFFFAKHLKISSEKTSTENADNPKFNPSNSDTTATSAKDASDAYAKRQVGWLAFLAFLYTSAMFEYWYWEFDTHTAFAAPFSSSDLNWDVRSTDIQDWQCPEGWLQAVRARKKEDSKKTE